MDVENQLKELIMTLAGGHRAVAEIAEITAESSLTDDLGIDSILLVQLIVEIETTFDIEFSDDDLEVELITRFGNLRTVVERRVADSVPGGRRSPGGEQTR